MVEETNLEGKIVYKCMKCSWLYKSKELAEKCQSWCDNHKSCNFDIVKHAIKLNKFHKTKGDKS